MLSLTDEAAAAIRDITAAPELPEGAGLRIAPAPDDGLLAVTLEPGPAPDDEVLDVAGARLFVAAGTAPLLDGQTLDARTADDGPDFYLTPQQAPGKSVEEPTGPAPTGPQDQTGS